MMSEVGYLRITQGRVDPKLWFNAAIGNQRFVFVNNGIVTKWIINANNKTIVSKQLAIADDPLLKGVVFKR